MGLREGRGGVQMANGPPTWINTAIFTELNMCIYAPDMLDCSTHTLPLPSCLYVCLWESVCTCVCVPLPSNTQIYHNHTSLTSWHDMRLRIQAFPHGGSHESTMRCVVELLAHQHSFPSGFRLWPCPKEWNRSRVAAAMTHCCFCGSTLSLGDSWGFSFLLL